MSNGSIEKALVDGLGDVSIHAGGEAGDSVGFLGLGRKRDDRQPRQAGLAPDAPGDFETVHFGHLHVHEHDIEVGRFQPGERLAAAAGKVGFHADCGEKIPSHLAIERIVIDDERPLADEHRLAGNGWPQTKKLVAQDVRMNRFREMAIHARFARGASGLGIGVAGHGHDGKFVKTRFLADFPGGFDAIHTEHFHVQQDIVEISTLLESRERG